MRSNTKMSSGVLRVVFKGKIFSLAQNKLELKFFSQLRKFSEFFLNFAGAHKYF